ncbi:MAG TPA: TolC family protein [Thermoanaerobaculia bacterium]|nr:TolC family protein [Thermoanaerobaculia bacterium]
MRSLVSLTLVVLTLVLPAGATAQETAQEPARLTLAEAVERALARYPGVGAARARQEQAREAITEAKASRRPAGRLNATGTQYEEPMVVTPIHGFGPGLFPEFDTTVFQGTLTVSYTLWDGGATEARIRSAGEQAGVAGAALGAAEQALARRVAASYLTAQGQSQVLAAHDRRLAALQGELSRARQRFDAGKAAQVEVIRAEAAVAAAEAQRVALAAAVGNAERDLARLLDAPLDEVRAGRLAPVTLAGPALPPREALVADGLAVSPAVEQARRQVEASRAAEALARSAYRPTLRAVGNYNEWASSEGDFTGEWNAGFQFAVPLFDFGVTRSRVAQSAAATRAAAEQLRLAELQVREEVDRAAADTEQALAQVASLEKAVERFAEVVRVQKLLLDTGAGTQIDYLNAEAELLAARASLATAENAAALARMDLARATGRLGPEWLRQNLRQTETTP